MKKITLLISLFVLLFVLFFISKTFSGMRTLEIKDLTKEQVITLSEINKPKSVHSIRITVVGYIDGSAAIQRSYEEKEIYSPEIISGKVDLRLGSDWYADRCLLIYKPANVKSGNLRIKYKFYTL